MYVTSPVKTLESEIAYAIDFDRGLSRIRCQEMTFEGGDALFFEGDEADYIYEVMEGVVRSSKVLIDGRRQVLNFCYPGDMIGYSHDSRYHCDCDAVSKVRVRIFRKNAFMHDLVNDPDFCARLLKNAAAEVNNMQEHFLMLGRKTAMEKLASFLVAVMDRSATVHRDALEFDLPMKRSDIADFLGVTIETVSRNLTKLRRMGVIDLPKTQLVRVSSSERLRALAENEK